MAQKTIFERIKEEVEKSGGRFAADRPGMSWLRSKINELRPTRNALMQDAARLRDKTIIGRMYFMHYDPKHKKTLPYYDTFPLVIPIDTYHNGFLGLNLHYISPKYRMILLNRLMKYATNKNYDERTRFSLSYDLLTRAAKSFEHTPCIKRYLFNHVQSRFLEINASEWDIAILLPFQNFVGASESKVWSDSRRKM